ncbi:hypothetical protein D9R13_11585 [Mycobacteroides abscessus subsp. massiliense]|nr:hypothetical protein D9R13_11585 [Mycobacteroides abscessus subsp. massiliense]
MAANRPKPIPTRVRLTFRTPVQISCTSIKATWAVLVTDEMSRPGSLPSINVLVNTYGSCSTAEVSLTKVAMATTTSTQPAVVNVIQRWRRIRVGGVWR